MFILIIQRINSVSIKSYNGRITYFKKSDLATKMNTVYRLLDENNNSVTLDTLEKAYQFLNKKLIIKFV
ncbi:hypothetical protein [Brachyspira hyodysenteriae]|uniref:hypothetical protein n=1 Tax=Brachyspira hyodysenteriae TaxID=159 RepID=UPI0022CDDC66|nr:hypothetical protein [Brachyspira hyodysenteriae]MDA0024887.1 hypothetical protein [Brachyspira hyodysenteriae]